MKPPYASARGSMIAVSIDGLDARGLTVEQAQYFEVKLAKAIKEAKHHRAANHRLVFFDEKGVPREPAS